MSQLKTVVSIMKEVKRDELDIECEYMDDDVSDEEVISPPPPPTSNIIANTMTNISMVLDDMKDGKRGKNDTISLILASIEEVIEVRETNRTTFINTMLSRRFDSDEEEVSNRGDEEKSEIEILIEDKEVRMKKVPALEQLGIPLNPDMLQIVVREIAMLSNMFPKEKILSYQNWRGIKNELVQVPVCKNKETFDRMNRSKGFIDSIPSLIRGANTSIDNGEVASWVIRRLGHLYEDKFVKVGKELGYNFAMERMDVNMAQAMWDEANINTRSQRTIMRYMKASFGNKCIIPSSTDKKMTNLETLVTMNLLIHYMIIVKLTMKLSTSGLNLCCQP